MPLLFNYGQVWYTVSSFVKTVEYYSPLSSLCVDYKLFSEPYVRQKIWAEACFHVQTRLKTYYLEHLFLYSSNGEW